ncbi:hypothetical protein ANSO36C_50600 [Nostoc cf. commune SO-36]|uniref:Uncharacterized protein n=2 Tax=Nostoc commune TaxID=1178 RepID=A0ABM7Z7V3_NOSCO|nr:hypothetical protein ANSO36C_50600 [Nostoc cf. commune SO-36]
MRNPFPLQGLKPLKLTKSLFGIEIKTMLKTTNLKNISKKFAIARNRASFKENEAMRAIAYSMDLLLPGLYIWLFGFNFRIGGNVPDDVPYKYPGKIHSNTGIALVLPGYKVLTTYQGSYDPKQTSNTGASTF